MRMVLLASSTPAAFQAFEFGTVRIWREDVKRLLKSVAVVHAQEGWPESPKEKPLVRVSRRWQLLGQLPSSTFGSC